MMKPSVPNKKSPERSPRRASPVARRGLSRRWTRFGPRAHLTRWLSVGSPSVDRPMLAVVLGLLLSGVIVPPLTYWPLPTGSLGCIAPLLFLLPVVLAASLGGWRAGACVTVVAVAVWDWFFLLPAQSLAIDSTDDVVTLLVYLTVAALLGQLSMAMRRRATAAMHHEGHRPVDGQRWYWWRAGNGGDHGDQYHAHEPAWP